MADRNKINPVYKIQAAKAIIAGKATPDSEAKRLNVNAGTVREWERHYRREGAIAFLTTRKEKAYPRELKLAAIHDYQNGEGTMLEIAEKYNIRTRTEIIYWVKQYNTYGDVSGEKLKAGNTMSNTEKTKAQERRIMIALECIANGKNYSATAKEFGCSYQQVRNWVKRYEEMGEAGLEDRRGKRLGSMPGRTKEERLQYKLAELERENKKLKVENAVLKKLKELEMRDRYL